VVAALLIAAGIVIAFAGMRVVVTSAGGTAHPSHVITPGSTLGAPTKTVSIG